MFLKLKTFNAHIFLPNKLHLESEDYSVSPI